jgi:large subunit ribosomal protein L4
MVTVDVRKPTGDRVGTTTLDPHLFEVTPNVAVMHQVVVAQLAAARSGTHSTLTRAEVRGGGRKPWRQKGSGRARQGSSRAPHWAGGGVAFGPKPRDYRQRTPKKMVQLALRSALSDRASEGKVVIVDSWNLTEPKTREARAALDALGVSGKILIVLAREDENAAKSFRNLPTVHLMLPSELNAYDVLVSDWVIFTKETLPGTSETEDLEPAVIEAQATNAAEEPVEAGKPEAGKPEAGKPEAEPDEGEPDWDAPLKDKE